MKQPQEGNIIAEYVVNGIHGYIMDTYLHDVSEEEMNRRVQHATQTAQRILEKDLLEHSE